MNREKLARLLDPYQQSVFHFRTSPLGWFIFGSACLFIFLQKSSLFWLIILYNPFITYPNVYLHSLVGHFFLGPLAIRIFPSFFHYFLPAATVKTIENFLLAAADPFSEILLPLIGLILFLRLRGGRYILPIVLYWLSVSLFTIGMCIVDPGSHIDILGRGDWEFILGPLGLLAYHNFIGNMVIILSIVCFVFAVWSPFYYWTHMAQYSFYREY